MKNTFLGLLFTLFLCLTTTVESSYTIRKGQLIDTSEVATLAVDEHFNLGICAYEREIWSEAAIQFSIVTACFPDTTYSQQAYFYQGVAYYYLKEYDFANDAFTQYLTVQNNPQFFEETIQFKFAIAESLADGAKIRCFCSKRFPKWFSGTSLAIEIFDEIIAAVPCHDIAAQSLVSKGWLHWRHRNYRGAVEAFQQVIRRFPKHELTPECYVMISHVYLDQSGEEFQNSDILIFAELNLQKFTRDFPREERLCLVQEDLMGIKETYAKGLYEMGQYYERKYKPRAAIIYYNNAIYQFPETCIADLCRERMQCLMPSYQDTSRLQQPDEGVQEVDFVPGEDLFINGTGI